MRDARDHEAWHQDHLLSTARELLHDLASKPCLFQGGGYRGLVESLRIDEQSGLRLVEIQLNQLYAR